MTVLFSFFQLICQAMNHDDARNDAINDNMNSYVIVDKHEASFMPHELNKTNSTCPWDTRVHAASKSPSNYKPLVVDRTSHSSLKQHLYNINNIPKDENLLRRTIPFAIGRLLCNPPEKSENSNFKLKPVHPEIEDLKIESLKEDTTKRTTKTYSYYNLKELMECKFKTVCSVTLTILRNVYTFYHVNHNILSDLPRLSTAGDIIDYLVKHIEVIRISRLNLDRPIENNSLAPRSRLISLVINKAPENVFSRRIGRYANLILKNYTTNNLVIILHNEIFLCRWDIKVCNVFLLLLFYSYPFDQSSTEKDRESINFLLRKVILMLKMANFIKHEEEYHLLTRIESKIVKFISVWSIGGRSKRLYQDACDLSTNVVFKGTSRTSNVVFLMFLHRIFSGRAKLSEGLIKPLRKLEKDPEFYDGNVKTHIKFLFNAVEHLLILGQLLTENIAINN